MKTFGKTLILATAAAATFATVVPAMAQGMGNGPDRVPPLFAETDTNHDGVISRAEFDAKHDEQFKKFDRDGNGSISLQEMKDAREKMMEQRGDRRGDRGKHGDFAKRDGHHGKMKPRERDAGQLQRLLELVDSNGSGGVTQDEVTAFFKKLDANGDGTVTVAETRDGMRTIMRDARAGGPGNPAK